MALQTSAPFRAAGLRLALLLAAALLLTSCDENESASAQSAPPPPPEVGFITVHPQPVELTTELPGRTVAFRKAEVRPQVDGIIQKRLFDEGATVEAGQPLYQIDPATYQAALRVAEANLARAHASLKSSQSRLDRYVVLIKRNAVSQQEHDDVLAEHAEDEADVAAAEAQLESARINLKYTIVKAPIGGRIGRSNITEGALVTANQETSLATITQLDPIYVDVTQSSAELMRTRQAIQSGEIVVPGSGEVSVSLFIDATGTAYPHEGRMQFSEVLVKETTGTVSLRAVFPNPELDLMPGLFVHGKVSQGKIEGGFLVPQAALARGHDGGAYLWLIGADDMATRQPVTVRRSVGESWLITGGLADGDRVVVDGLQRLRTDSKVTPIPTDQQDSPDSKQPPSS